MSENPSAVPQVGNSTWGMDPTPGMTLRDWFAGQAMNGLLSSHAGCGYERDAREAYRFADAMLAHRLTKETLGG